jgi:membrane protein
MKNRRIRSIIGLWKDSFKGFAENKIPKLGASLAYYTVFSLGPLLIVIIFLCSLFLGREAVEGAVYEQVKGFVGDDSARQIENIIRNASVTGKGPVAAIVGIFTLLVGATTIFGEIQDSVNQIWGIKAKPKKNWLHLIKNRLLSFGIIGSLGFLLLVSLAVSTLLDVLDNKLRSILPDMTFIIFYVINLLITLGITTLLFAVIFKVLPDAQIRWKEVWPGALVTALLFMAGKFAISFYISKASIGDTYGAAGSLVVLLVWVYYSAFILYFGAVFTKTYAIKQGRPILPDDYAVAIKKVEVNNGKAPVEKLHSEKK